MSQHSVSLVVFLAVLLTVGSFDRLEAQVRRSPASALRGRSAEHYLARGKKLITKGLYAGAVRSLSLAIKRRPGLAEAYLLRGSAYDRMGRPGKAIQDLSRYIEKKPSDPTGYIRRGDDSGVRSGFEPFSRMATPFSLVCRASQDIYGHTPGFF